MANEEMTLSHTPYDDAFRTMIQKGGNLRIPFVNEMFSLASPFDRDTPIETISNEFYIEEGQGHQKKIITDAVLRINGKLYHIECQTNPDGTILVRMFQYDMSVSLIDKTYEDYHLTVEIPSSSVLFLRKKGSTPDKMTVTIKAGDAQLDYKVPTVTLADYTLDDLVEKNLLFLFPFYMFNLEGEFKGYEEERETSREKVIGSMDALLDHVNEMYDAGDLSIEQYLLITDMLRKVTDSLTANYETVRKELDDIMGGKVLEFKGEKIIDERNREIATNLIKDGTLTDQQIASSCGLELKDVQKLREELTVTV